MNNNLHPQLQKCHEKFNLQNSTPLFDYSETVYEDVYKKPLTIKCLKCNTYFEQFYQNHLRGAKTKCKCRAEKRKLKLIEEEKQALIRKSEREEKRRLKLIEDEKRKSEREEKRRLKLIEEEKQALIHKSEREEKRRLKLIEEEKQALIRKSEQEEKRRLKLIEDEKRKIAREKKKQIENQNRLLLFIEKAQAINDNINEFNYNKVELKLIKNKQWALNIKCNNCGEYFDQRTDKHLEGQGHKKCRSHVHNIETYRGKPTTLYYVKVHNTEVKNLYKIGLTMTSIKQRFSKEKNNSLIQQIEEIKTWRFEDGADAFLKEQEIIKSYKSIKYDYQENGELLKAGNSELFTENILNEIVPFIELF